MKSKRSSTRKTYLHPIKCNICKERDCMVKGKASVCNSCKSKKRKEKGK